MTHKRYLVTGGRQYRWHKPGTTFEAQLEPLAEQRAIERGAIRVLEIVEPDVQIGSYQLPQDWPLRAVDAQPTRGVVGVSEVN